MFRALFLSSIALTAMPAFVLGASVQEALRTPSATSDVVVRTDSMGRRALAGRDGDTRVEPVAEALYAPQWRALGPYGGDIDDVHASPANAQIVLAGLAPSSGAGGGLYRSSDAGATWTEVAQLSGISVYKVAFAPDGTAFIGTIDSVWKSVDGGASWTQVALGIGPNDQIQEVTIDPSDPQRIWIGIADALGGQPVNVMLSTNGGTSFVNRTPPLASPLTCSGIAVHPTDSNRVYACFAGAFGGGQVWVSSNGGTSWINRSAGLPNRPMNDLAHDGSRVLLSGGQLFGGQTVGLYSSVNEGVTWVPIHDGTWPNLAIQDIALDPTSVSTILVASAGSGVFRSVNGGTSWSFGIGGTASLSVNAVSFSPGSSSVIYTGSSANAVWKSVDGGGTFVPSSTGIGRLDVFSVASNPNNPAELAIAFQGLNDGGVYTSLDGGLNWTLEVLPATRFSAVLFAPNGRLHAISSGPSSIAPEGVYRRIGGTWSGIGPDQGTLFESELFALRVSSNDPDRIFASGNDFGVAGFEPTIWRYASGIWTKTYEGGTANESVRDLAIVTPATDLTLSGVYANFAGGSGGALRSINGGLGWSPANTGLPVGVQCFSIAASPSGPSTLYLSNSAAGAHAIYRSIDGGQSWTGTGYFGTAIEVATDFADPAILYLAPNGGPNRVLASDNGGTSFVPFDTGLAGAGFVRDLQRAPGTGRELLLATQTGSYATAIASFVPYCFGDGSTATACPCGNTGAAERGCANSVNASGALLVATGATSPDSAVLTASGMPATALSIFIQGNVRLFSGVVFGDGVRCVGGSLKRISVEASVGGTSSYPGGGDPSISARSAALGDPFGPGAIRYYQTYYRNPNPAFCPAPVGNTFNITNGVQVNW
jgi:hypothetical protein